MGGLFDIPSKEKNIELLENKMNEPNFWDNIEEANKLNKELTLLKKEISTYNTVLNKLSSNKEIAELLELEYNEEFKQELEK